MIIVFHDTPVNAVLFLNNLNFDGLAGKRQKRQNFPPSKFSAIRYVHYCDSVMLINTLWQSMVVILKSLNWFPLFYHYDQYIARFTNSVS